MAQSFETIQGVNVDHAEIDKFASLAHRWWDVNSEFKPLHEINPIRLSFINEIAQLQGKKIVDVGCGGGILSESMAHLGGDVTGLDLGGKALKVAQLHALETGATVNYQCVAVEDWAMEHAGEYDVVTCMEMLEHVPNPASVVAACAKLVKPNGHVFFSTINRGAKAYLQAVIGAEYLLNMLPQGTHDYAKFIKPSELAAWCRANDLNPTTMRGMGYSPLSQHYFLHADTSVNYLLHTQKSAT